MIQFNLLPDVKLEYVKAQRTKHTVISAALIAATSAFAIFLLLFLVVHVAQKKNISDLSTDIKNYSTELKNTPDLGKILTIQSQLSVLPRLHGDKVAAGRTFKFIQQFTPINTTISEFKIDFTANTIEITGQAPGLDKVNTFVDTLKFTKFTDGTVTDQHAFSGIVLSQFTRSATSTTYTITASFDPAIYKNQSNVNLAIPSTVSTRSVIEQPTDIFKKATK